MDKSYKGGVLTTAGFEFRSDQPLDDRFSVVDYEDLNGLTGYAYKGLIVFVESNKCHYYYDKDTGWHKLFELVWEDYLTEE